MASPGWASLGNAIAGGNALNGALAYENGAALGARTMDALAQARARVDQNNANENIDAALKGAIPDDKVRAAIVGAIQGGHDPNQVFQAAGTAATNARNNQIANTATPDDQTARDLLANGRPAELVHPVGTAGSFTNELHPSKGVSMSPLATQIAQGQAAEAQAGANQKNAAAALDQTLTKQGGVKAPAGYVYDGVDAQGHPKMRFVGGGPADPSAPGKLGSREATYLNRVLGSGKQVAAAVSSVLAAPLGSSSGVFGIGRTPGPNPLQATVDTFRNKLSGDDTQTYNTLVQGLSRNLAGIETSGLVPGGTFVGSFDNLQFREGDTVETRLHKLAEVRQIVDSGMDTLANNPRLPPQQQAYAREIQAEVDAGIPFTHADLYAMRGHPGMTVADAVKARKSLIGGAPGAPGAPATPSFPNEAAAAAAEAAGTLKKGTRVTIGGVSGTWQ